MSKNETTEPTPAAELEASELNNLVSRPAAGCDYPFLCFGGNPHKWQPTGMYMKHFIAGDTCTEIPDDAPREREERCYCGAVRWAAC